ncbi:MAG: thiazole synthase [Candidatus Tokpelaia sp. JSC161]|jgi:thiazole synthase|nr:MAG: thiazole synthase [Candidatus Tokpelaia sp. JSC161]
MLRLYGQVISSRLLLGTAQYPSPAILEEAVRCSASNVITVSLRRETAGCAEGNRFYELMKRFRTYVLPNTAGCSSVKEAVLTAELARDLFKTNWIKLEVIGNQDTLQPDVFALVDATKILIEKGFEVFPYTTDDLSVASKLIEVGCKVLMPLCAPIGSAQGPRDTGCLRAMRASFPDIPLIVDAGVGRPSHAAMIMELGFDAILLNTAVAKAEDPVKMAKAFAQAIDAGRLGFQAGLLEPRDIAVSSTPVIGQAVFYEA